MKKQNVILVILLVIAYNLAQAQIGINTTNPHPSTALDVNGGGFKGILIPEMDNANRAIRKTNNDAAQGLLVRDTSGKLFFFYDGQNWIALNPVQALDGGDTVKLSADYQMVKLSSNLNVDKALTVKGNTTLQNPTAINNTLNVTGNTQLGGAVAITGKVTTNNGIDVGATKIASGAIEVANTKIKNNRIDADTINAKFGTVPLGGIIMWSGKVPPIGWELCNGQNGTPNLKSQFIVGYDPDVTDYNQPGNKSGLLYYPPCYNCPVDNSTGKTGGEKEHTLTIDEMPSHRHKMSARKVQGDNDGDMATHESWGNADHYTNYVGGNQPHENRPPYFVLAFIMRVQ